tara:strand:+ start:85 stop:363 length:279 start_codon:yes stop_codon:yes gene_type:complete
MRLFTFETLDGSEIESKEYKGLKQALFDVQRSIKGRSVRVMYKNKGDNDIDRWVKIPIGRKKKGFQIPEPFMTPKMKKKEEEKKAKKQGYGG